MFRKPKVFLSYASEDRETVTEIYRFLAENACDPWMDKEKLLPGQDWATEITIAIETADYFFACLSRKSVDKRGYVQKELKKGLDVLDSFPEGKIFVIPIRLEECNVPRSFSNKHWLDWFDFDSHNKLLEAMGFHTAEIESLKNEFFSEETPDYKQATIIDHLAEIGERAIPALLEILGRLPEFGNDAALIEHSLLLAFTRFPQTLPAVLEIFDSSNEDLYLQGFLIEVFGAIGSEAVVPILINCIQDERPKNREQAIAVSASIQSEQLTRVVANCLHDNYKKIRNQAAFTLGLRKDEFAVPALLEAFHLEIDTDVKVQIATTLIKLGDPSPLKFLNDIFETKKREWLYGTEELIEALQVFPQPEAKLFIGRLQQLIHERKKFTQRKIQEMDKD